MVASIFASQQPAFHGGGSTILVVPVSASEAYVVAPHPSLGAIALRLVKGNAGSVTTPSNSIGLPFGNWRLYGVRRLAAVTDNPATNYREIISDDVGSQQYAMAFNSIYGGVFHGGLTFNTEGVIDLTIPQYVPSFSLAVTFTIDWGLGVTTTGTDTLTLTPSGELKSDTTILGGPILDPVYLDMTIASSAFDRAKGLVDADYTALIMNADGTTDTDYSFNTSDTMLMRNRASGTIVTVTDDSRASAEFNRKWVRRSPVGSNSQRSKLYAKMVSAPLTPFPANRVQRTITFSKSTPDVFSWTAAAGGAGYDGTYPWPGGTVTNTGTALRFTRSATIGTNIGWLMGVEAGATYRLPISTALAGGGATNSGNGMAYAIQYADIGSIVSPLPIVTQTFAQTNVAAGGTGYLQFTAPANVDTLQCFIRQTTGTAGQLVDVTSLGPLAKFP